MADRGRPADRRQALSAGEPRGDRGEAGDRGSEALGRGCATVHRQCHADVEPAVRQRREADVVAAADVHLPVLGQLRIAGVVSDETKAAREPDRALDAGQPGDGGADAVGADHEAGVMRRRVPSPDRTVGAGHALAGDVEPDEASAFDQLGAAVRGVARGARRSGSGRGPTTGAGRGDRRR